MANDEPSPPLKVNLPDNLKPWDVTEKMSDYQLKVALQYLNTQTTTPGRVTAKAAAVH